MRRRRSKHTLETLTPIVKKAYSLREVLRLLGYSPSSGSMFNLIRRKIKEYNIDISHFSKTHNIKKKSLEDILVKNSLYNRGHLKRKLLKLGLLKNECYICGLKDTWQDKPIVMTLDHINGDSCDHRLENLRLICPNCGSQLPTFAGRNSFNNS
jgi:hypothetical protein